MAQLGADLTTPTHPSSSPWDGAGVLPLSRLTASDFQTPDNYLAAAFPGPDTDERSRVREMLTTLRARIQKSGLVPTSDPSADSAGATFLNAPATSPMAAPDDSLPVPSSLPPLSRSVPYFTPPVGPLGTRLRAFIDWLRRQVSCTEAWVVDRQGSPITDGTAATPELGGAAAIIAEASRRALKHVPGAEEGSVQLDLPGDRKLCVIDTPTTLGDFCLCLVHTESLAPRAAERLRRALRRTVENDGVSTARPERW